MPQGLIDCHGAHARSGQQRDYDRPPGPVMELLRRLL